MKKVLVIFLFLLNFSLNPERAQAQCAMCSVNAEQGVKNGNTEGKGLNSGILYLLAIPYVLVASVGTLWYLNYRKKDKKTVA